MTDTAHAHAHPAPPAQPPMRQGIVLSGGGANGAYEVGVLKALFSGRSPATQCCPLRPEVLAGTSVGSFNATFLAAHWERYGEAAVNNLEAVWLDRIADRGRGNGVYRFRADPLQVVRSGFGLPNPLPMLTDFANDSVYLAWEGTQRLAHLAKGFTSRSGARLEQRLVEVFDLATAISLEPMEDLLENHVPWDAVQASDLDLRVAATNFSTGRVVTFANHDLTRAMGPRVVMASAALPGIFPAVPIGVELHVDGSVLMSTPLKPSIAAGASEIHVIYLDLDVRSIPFAELSNSVGALYRMMAINWAWTVERDIEEAESINLALAAVDDLGVDGEPSGDRWRTVLRALGSAAPERFERYRPLVIHRYSPHSDLGGGAIGLLDFDRVRMLELIERGYTDAVYHDCEREECVLWPPAHRAPTSAEKGHRDD